MHHIRSIFTALITMLGIVANADVTVSNSEQLRQVLSKDQDLGNIYLTANQYVVDGIEVRAGGTLCPKDNERVTFIGTNNTVKINTIGVSDKPLADFKGPRTFIITDTKFKEYPISQPTVVLNAKAIEQIDASTRAIRIKCNDELTRLLEGLDQQQLFYTLGKLSMWFHCANMTNLRYADGYVYGNLNTDQYYKAIPYVRTNTKTIVLVLYNLPMPGTTYVDTRGYLHCPQSGANLLYYTKSVGLQPVGKRQLIIRNIDFVGMSVCVQMGKRAANKTIDGCTFKYSNTGVSEYNGDINYLANITVKNCSFTDMYNNDCLVIRGCDNTLVIDNTFERTGLINRAFTVVDLTGNNFVVRGNTIKAFTYNGIRIGQNRKYGVMQNSGVVEGNLIDNLAYYKDSSKCLNDGGGIYIYTHQDNTIVRGNVICNIGYTGGSMRGIFLDDGAYNTTVTGNLVYNIFGSYAIDSREVKTKERHNGNNRFTDNVIIGSIRVYGPTSPLMAKTIVSNNYIDGSEKFGTSNMVIKNNTTFKPTVSDDGITVGPKIYKQFKKRLSPFVMRFISK